MEVTSEDEDLSKVQINEEDIDKGWGALLAMGSFQIPIIKYTPEAIFSNQVPALDVNFITPKNWEDDNMNQKSVTQALHSTIANWYIGLRNLAIIALLSVLLYVGIRMVISSTASDKAKYKQMFMDWVVALCIVFFLHYVMSFILTITEMITDGISSSSEIIVQIQNNSGATQTEFKTNLTGLTRLQVQYKDLGIRIIYLIFYLALVIYTVMFTWTYIKRAITMAFLTLMAPLVAITYPIDKIGDGKAQAFSVWLREFIFNALLQPFHLIIYTIFLGGASQIAAVNPIFAILFLAFIIPSEKLLRKMFGFDKASTAGGMSTAAGILGGAAVMKSAGSLIGKIGKKGGQSSSGGKGVRTKNAVTSSNAPGKTKDLIGTFGENTDGGNGEGQDSNRALPQGEEETQNSSMNTGENSTQAANATAPIQSQQTQARNKALQQNAWSLQRDENGKLDDSRGLGEYLRGGLSQTAGGIRQNLRGKFDQTRIGQWAAGNTKGAQRLRTIKNMPRTLKGLYNSKNPYMNTIRGAIGTAGKAASSAAKFTGKAAVGGTLGLAAGIAGDDLEDVVKYGAAGAALGVTGLPVLGRGITSGAASLRSTYETQAFGSEEAALRDQARELKKDKTWNEEMERSYTDIYGQKPTAKQSREFKNNAIEYYSAGITDSKEIKKSMEFEKKLKEKLVADGISEDDATENARKQAIVISKLASETKYEQLTNPGKREDLKNRFVKEYKAGGLDEKAAVSNADSTINLIMKRKGLSPD